MTDADVVLGYLDREALLGGALRIDLAAAERAIDAAIARPLGLTVPEAAARIVEVVNSNMAQALRIVSIERGHDPQEFSLIAFGGAGPVHAVSLAEELQIPEVIVPPAPGAFSALGLVASDLQARLFAHAVRRSRQHRSGACRRGDRGMEQAGREMLRAARVPPERQALLRQADVRYRRQAYELTVPIADGEITRATLDELAEAFHARHEQTYGHANRAEPVQLVNLRLTALGRLPDLVLAQRADPASARVREPRRVVRRERLRADAGALARRADARHADRRPGDHRGDGLDHRRAAGLAARGSTSLGICIRACARTSDAREAR